MPSRRPRRSLNRKQLVSTKLEIDVENLAFRGCRSLSYLGEQKSY